MSPTLPSPLRFAARTGGQAQPGRPGGQRAAGQDGRRRRPPQGGLQDQPQPVGAGQRHLGAGGFGAGACGVLVCGFDAPRQTTSNHRVQKGSCWQQLVHCGSSAALHMLQGSASLAPPSLLGCLGLPCRWMARARTCLTVTPSSRGCCRCVWLGCGRWGCGHRLLAASATQAPFLPALSKPGRQQAHADRPPSHLSLIVLPPLNRTGLVGRQHTHGYDRQRGPGWQQRRRVAEHAAVRAFGFGSCCDVGEPGGWLLRLTAAAGWSSADVPSPAACPFLLRGCD